MRQPSVNLLATLRNRLRALARWRRAVGWSTALGALVLLLVWSAVIVFLVDFHLDINRAGRAASLLAWAGAGGWAFRRFVLPRLRRAETELEVALWLERQQKIDSDLVAALQFEPPAAASWGSRRLELAVVEYMAGFGKELNVLAYLPIRKLVCRAAALVVTIVAIGAVAAGHPAHARAFVNRFFLGAARYPSTTRLVLMAINGREVAPGPEAATPKSAYGEPLRFEVRCSGELPSGGRVELATLGGGLKATVELVPVPGRPGFYRGKLARLIDSVTYELQIGDARTEPARILAVSRPSVAILWRPTPPAYAAALEPAGTALPDARQISVMEGSGLDLRVRCTNKALRRVTLSIGGSRFDLVCRDAARRHWRLPAGATPLARVTAAVHYTVQAADEDGLEMAEALGGLIRVRADQGPRVAAAVVTPYVLPTARPNVMYAAADDFALARLRMHRRIARQAGPTVEDTVEIPLGRRPPKSTQGRLPLDLGPLELVKGDQLRIVFEAIDFRGPVPGKSALGEPVVLEVTDERGVLEAVAEADMHWARNADTILEQQLDMGARP